MYEVEKLKSLGLRAPTSAQNSVANQTNLQLEQDSADPSPQTPPAKRGTWVAKEKGLRRPPPHPPN